MNEEAVEAEVVVGGIPMGTEGAGHIVGELAMLGSGRRGLLSLFCRLINFPGGLFVELVELSLVRHVVL